MGLNVGDEVVIKREDWGNYSITNGDMYLGKITGIGPITSTIKIINHKNKRFEEREFGVRTSSLVPVDAGFISRGIDEVKDDLNELLTFRGGLHDLFRQCCYNKDER